MKIILTFLNTLILASHPLDGGAFFLKRESTSGALYENASIKVAFLITLKKFTNYCVFKLEYAED